MKVAIWSVLVAILVAATIVCVLYLFRSEVDENSALGRVTIKYVLGRPYSIAADVDRDGRIDFQGSLDAPFGSYASHTSVLVEYWESSRKDGVLDRHVLLKDGIITKVEVDEDHDGTFETILTGTEAENFYESLSDGGLRP